MQDPATFPAPARFPEEERHVIKCPRCDSPETKFCYYNNYNLSQPRHFCKSCRRYWTKGGTLRNVPVGGGARKKGKRPKSLDPTRTRGALPVSSTSSMVEESGSGPDPERLYGFSGEEDRKMQDVTGSFCSILASSGQFGSLREGLNPNGSSSKMVKLGYFGEKLDGDGSDPTRTWRAVSSTSSMVEDSGSRPDPERLYGLSGGQDWKMLDVTGSFSSILTSSGQFGSLREELHPNGPGSKMVKLGDFGEELDGDGSGMESDPGRCPGLDEQSNDGSEGFLLQSGESSFWPDLGVYTHGSCFQ